jgi:hypothetical protein
MPAQPLKFSVFISSRNLDPIVINDSPGESLTEVRLFLKDKLEAELFLGEKYLLVEINETFGMDGTENSYNICMQHAAEADLVIVLYNGEAGWGPDGNGIGICHAELDAAFQASSKKVAIVDISKFSPVPAATGEAATRNSAFKNYYTKLNRFNNPLKLRKADQTAEGFRNALLKSLQNIISRHFAARIAHSNMYYAMSANNTVAKDWQQLNYEPLSVQMKERLSALADKDLFFKDALKISHAIPDRMSEPDARSYTGRPFLSDQDAITQKGVPDTATGPLHFIAVFGPATVSQVKGIIGYPDISVIKDDFGYYLWEQHMHIQLVVLTDCTTPVAIATKFQLFQTWATGNDEVDKINNRAKARSHILRSINQAGVIADGK